VAEVGAEVVAREVDGEEARELGERGGGEGAGEVEVGREILVSKEASVSRSRRGRARRRG
jgi:hypothetical protein